jgi:DNA-directed RNA polymerase subunit RPC12/RpoP
LALNLKNRIAVGGRLWNVSATAMSEYKYACPVCGQHMMCDSSQAGTVMECPTCFQKITAPQAPATDDTKFIITGTKVGERPIPKILADRSTAIPAAKSFPLGLVVLLLALVAAGAGIFAYRGKIFPHGSPVAMDQTGETSAPKKVLQPNLRPASDTNWTFTLDGLSIPDTAAAGWVHGQQFTCDRAIYSTNGTLTVRSGQDLNVAISFNGAQASVFAGKSINVKTNTDRTVRVMLHWRDDSQNGRENYDGGYALRLEFGAVAGNRLPGKIYLVTPDAEKSYVAGTFNAEVRRPRAAR